MITLALTLWAMPQSSHAEANQKLFVQAKDAFANADYRNAARLCWQYMARSSKGAEKYESAQFFLAASLAKLGLYHAAVQYYFEVANTRRSPELLPRSLRALETISLERPIDRDLILRDLIGDTDFGKLQEETGDFVAYWQALSNLYRGLDDWTNERFAAVRRIGYYYYASLYASSVRMLHPNKPHGKQRAIEAFADLFGPLDLAAALESLRRRGESDGKLAYSLKAMIDEDNKIQVRFSRLPKGWEVELAMLGFARVAAEAKTLLPRAAETDEEELGRPFAYQVQIGGIPIYRRAPRFEDRAPMIKAVANRLEPVRKIQGKALHSLARLLYEQKRFGAAYDTLGQIPHGTELSSEILLERAWAKYRAGDAHRAMGLLYALDAPVYTDLFAPEKYVLRGLIYRKFCHFRAAKVAARRFRLEYAATLNAIRAGKDLLRIKRVRLAALRRGEALRRHLFLQTLRHELSSLEDFEDEWKKGGLLKHLTTLYRSKITQVRSDLLRRLETACREIAEQMLNTEEQVYLLEYEVGQAIFERVSDVAGSASLRKPAPKVPISSSRVYYRFADEYWTDELPWFKFNIEDRCVD